MTEETILCFRCGGRRVNVAYVCPGFRRVQRECEACKGTGRLPAAADEWRAAGERMRQERIARRIPIRDAAASLGIDVVRYSKIEFGLEPMP